MNSDVFYAAGRISSDVLYGNELRTDAFGNIVPQNPDAWVWRKNILKLSPTYSYEQISHYLNAPRFPVMIENEVVSIRTEYWTVIMNHLGALALLFILPVLSFAASYALFTRRDII